MKKLLRLFCISFFLCIFFNSFLYAIDAERYVKTDFPETKINFNTDHYTVSILKGWINSEDKWLKALLAKKTKLVVTIESKVTFFDGNKTENFIVYENTDMKSKTDRPFGSNYNILYNIPADAISVLTIKLAIYNEDRLMKIIDIIKNVTPATTDLVKEPYMTYGKLASEIISESLGTKNTDYPFYWSGNIKLPDVSTSSEMNEHFIILVAPTKDGQKFDASLFTYDKTKNTVKYNNAQLKNTYFVLQVKKSEGYNIPSLIAESTAAWALLASNQFFAPPVEDTNNKDELEGFVKNIIIQLKNEIELLKKEPRFSKNDRAVAIKLFATMTKNLVSKRCNDLKIKTNRPDQRLQNFIDQIDKIYNLNTAEKNSTDTLASKLLNDKKINTIKSSVLKSNKQLKKFFEAE